MTKSNLKSEVTAGKPRDEQGHFINEPKILPSESIISKFLQSHTGNYKDQDDLLDVRIGNPLGRIINLLEEIKKQKAFSFTLKGSLGIAGVVLALSVFGIFGGGKVICEKGTQSHIGTIKELNVREIYSKQVPVLSYLLELVVPVQKQIKHRSILIKNDQTTLYLPFNENVDFRQFVDLPVIVTGDYNSCNQTLNVDDADAIESF